MSDELVKVAEAGSELEAATIVGFLESCGIHAVYDKGGVFQPPSGMSFGDAFVGRQEILVRAGDAERAREALADAPL